MIADVGKERVKWNGCDAIGGKGRAKISRRNAADGRLDESDDRG